MSENSQSNKFDLRVPYCRLRLAVNAVKPNDGFFASYSHR